MNKRIAAVLIALIGMIGFAPSAFAGGSGPQPPAVVDDDSVTITATGCGPGEATFTLKDGDGNVVDTKTATIGSDGTATVTFDGLPTSTYTATYDCPDGSQVLGNLVVQSSGASPTAAALPNTGSDATITLARLGLLLLAAGGVAVYAGQRRSAKAGA